MYVSWHKRLQADPWPRDAKMLPGTWHNNRLQRTRKLAAEGPLPENVKAIYIGLFEGKENYTIHFLGSAEYDPDDDDWAC